MQQPFPRQISRVALVLWPENAKCSQGNQYFSENVLYFKRKWKQTIYPFRHSTVICFVYTVGFEYTKERFM